MTWRTTPAAAIRKGSWKWIQFYEEGEGELYDLAGDGGESRDRSSEESQRAASLRERLASWQRRVDAPFAVPGPDPAVPAGVPADAQEAVGLEASADASR